MSNMYYITCGIVRVFGLTGGILFIGTSLARIIRSVLHKQQKACHGVCRYCKRWAICNYIMQDVMPDEGCGYFERDWEVDVLCED